MLNILVVSQYYYPEPFRLNEICEELVKRGNKVTVLTANPNYPDGDVYDGFLNQDVVEELNGVKVYRCKCRPRYKGSVNLARNYVDFVRKANRRIMQLTEKYDCIYVYQLSPVTSCLPAIKYKKKYNTPIFLYCLDVWPESLRGTALGNPIGLKLMGYVSRDIYKSADALAVTSPTFSKYLSKLCTIDEEKIKYIPQHSGIIEFSEDKKNLIKDYDKVNFLFVGNIGEAQNLETLIKAISRISNKDKIIFHIVGSGSHYEECLRVTRDLKLEEVIKFYGRYPKSEMAKFYAIADVCYVSLKDEGIVGSTIPGKVQEYMSAGKPILAFMNGDTTEIIREAECGICVSANDFESLPSAIERITEIKESLPQLGNNARRYFQENFTVNSHVDRIERIMRELVR